MPRLSKKKSDRRWEAPNGTIWASRFEWQVYDKLRTLGYVVRKCEQGPVDTFLYNSNVTKGYCLDCGSSQVVQQRSYTPDLFISTDEDVDGGMSVNGGIYLETKGYFPASKRNLLRAFRKTGPHIALYFLAQRDLWTTKGKTKLSDYFAKYLKDVPFAVWDGQDIPAEWREKL